MRSRDKVLVVVLVACAFSSMFLKIRTLGPSLSALLPEEHRELLARLRLDGHGDTAQVRMALPVRTDRQSVRNEMVTSSDFRFHMERQDPNRWAVWEEEEARGSQVLVYSCTVRTEARKYLLAPDLPVPSRYPEDAQPHLMASGEIQSDAPEVRALLGELVPQADRMRAVPLVRAVFDYCHQRIRPAGIRGTTDALTCLRLQESSCGGKSRLMAALLRAAGVPARLAGGLILRDGSWTSSHVWVEAWLGGVWVPFCPLNGRYAEIPAGYLLLYVGDLPLFSHSRDINFSYVFHSKSILAPPASSRAPPAGVFNLWAAFESVGIPVDLLKIILVLPFGALVVVIARNLVGIHTFGTFMPALLAVGFRDTGLAWGLAMFVALLAVGAVARNALERFQLLHTPRLAVLLTLIVASVIGLALFGQASGHLLPTRVSLFPLVILTLTVERFAAVWDEDGPRSALLLTFGTALVIAAAHRAIESRWIQVAVLAFPECLLLVVAAFVVIGRFTGLRLLEYFRFGRLIAAGSRP